jgi:hypothetical protein
VKERENERKSFILLEKALLALLPIHYTHFATLCQIQWGDIFVKSMRTWMGGGRESSASIHRKISFSLFFVSCKITEVKCSLFNLLAFFHSFRPVMGALVSNILANIHWVFTSSHSQKPCSARLLFLCCTKTNTFNL